MEPIRRTDYLYLKVTDLVMCLALQQQTARIRMLKVNKGANIRNRFNKVPHLTQDTNGKVTNSQLDTTDESQEVSPFPAGDHKAHINRRVQRFSKHMTEQKHKRSTKEVPPWNGQKNILLEGLNQFYGTKVV